MKKELKRKYKIINMMISMHSIMYYNFKTKQLTGNIFFLIMAIILNIFIFFDFEHLKFLNLKESSIKYIISISTFVIFLLSVIFLLIEWGKKSERHKQAMNQLSRLLNELRSIMEISNSISNSKLDLFNELYIQTFETTPKIPDKKFNNLKAKHYRKIELSKFIDNHKGKPFFVIRILFLFKSIF